MVIVVKFEIEVGWVQGCGPQSREIVHLGSLKVDNH